MMITEAQADFIRKVVAEKIRLITLRDDLTDHLCCTVEDGMESGIDFEEALAAALADLAPAGLDQIQFDTDSLLNSTKITTMKKAMYTAGLLGTIGISMGIMFKLLHLRGAEQILNAGMALFILAYLPMKAYFHFRSPERGSVMKNVMMLSLGISGALVGAAIYFKLIQSIPIATVLLMVGVTAFSFVFLPLLFLDLYRRSVAE